MSSFVKDIYKKGNCCSCSLCRSVCPVGAISINVDKHGFFKPIIDEKKCSKCGLCSKLCPGGNAFIHKYERISKGEAPKISTSIPIYSEEDYVCGYSCDIKTRLDSASGGLTTELLVYLIENKICDYCSIVPTMDNTKKVVAKITNNVQDIIDAVTSKYCPVDYSEAMLQAKEYLKKGKKICFVLLPCQIQLLKQHFAKWERQIIYIALMCNHIPSYNATRYLLKTNNVKQFKNVHFRGGIWPGNMTICTGGKDISVPYIKEWGSGFGTLFYNRRCKICNDPFGIFADICVGDPYFIEKNIIADGVTFVIIRNPKVRAILEKMKEEGKISITQVDEKYFSHERFCDLYNRIKVSIPRQVAIYKLLRKTLPNGLQMENEYHLNRNDIKMLLLDIINRIVENNSFLWKIFYKRKKRDL